MSGFSRDFLRAVVDTLLPGLPDEGEMAPLPAASQVGGVERLADHLDAHPDRETLAAALAAIARSAGGEESFAQLDEAEATAVVAAVERTEAGDFAALLFAVAADYYETETVLRAFGWRPTPPQPEGYPLPPFDEALLEKVRRRGRLWRPV